MSSHSGASPLPLATMSVPWSGCPPVRGSMGYMFARASVITAISSRRGVTAILIDMNTAYVDRMRTSVHAMIRYAQSLVSHDAPFREPLDPGAG